MRYRIAHRLRRNWSRYAAAACGLCLATAASAQQDPAPDLPVYVVQDCCALCPEASNPAVYEGGYLSSFKMLVQGKDGWLFRTEDDLLMRYGLTPESFQAIAGISRFLDTLGVRLVMVPLPPRGLMAWSKLPDSHAAGANRDVAGFSYQALLADLRGRGVVVPDLGQLVYQPLEQPFYFRRDHHWTPYGARMVAELTAQAIRELPAYEELPRTQMNTQQEGILRKSGTYAEAVKRICGFSYPEQVIPRFTTSVEAAGGADLFGDAQKPRILLAGTSNSDPAYNFAGFLAQSLEVDVFNAAVAGGGLAASMVQLLADPEFRQDPPDILVWEMPAYSNFNDEAMYRQLLTLVHDGCAEQPAVLEADKALATNTHTEVLFNGDGMVQPIHGEEHLIDVRLSNPEVRKLRFTVWYTNGKSDNFAIERSRHVETGGRFTFALRSGPGYSDATFLGLDVGPDDVALPSGVTAAVELCRRPASLAGVQP